MGNGLLVTIEKDIPTILNCGEEVVEIVWYKMNDGKPVIQIKASKDVGITGAHLLQKAYMERDKLIKDLESTQRDYNFLIDQRIKEKNNDQKNS